MQHLLVITLISLFLSTHLTAVYAEEPVVVPEKIKADILKRYPKAIDMQASHEIHFKRPLLEVSFKVEGSEEPILELFRDDGHLFTNEMRLDDLSEAPPEVKQALEKEFPGYALKKAEMIGNPNGVGEEYEVYLVAGGANWKVSVTENGQIAGKHPF
jgi:hypothetical protein